MKKSKVSFWKNDSAVAKNYRANMMYRGAANNTSKDIKVTDSDKKVFYYVSVPVNYSGNQIRKLLNAQFGLNITDSSLNHF